MTHSDILDQVKKLHFVGIGGSGMCPIAEILLKHGYTITGSDINEGETLDKIRSQGIKVSMGHRGENIGDAEAVVYTAAVKADNPELVAAKEKGVPTIERSVMLGILLKRFQNSIAVSGTHGKTTTTSMITQLFIDAQKDPSAIIGGKLPSIGGNSKVGNSDIMICEACEYVDTFLQLFPSVSVILNVDADHLDYFKNMENIIRSFHQFASQTNDILVVNGDDDDAIAAVNGIEKANVVYFGFGENCSFRAVDIKKEDDARDSFTIEKNGEFLCRVTLRVPGVHNICNALAAACVADLYGIDGETISRSLGAFGGAHRRFEMLGVYGGITVADDFAHHPTELKVTLSTAMEMGYQNVWAVFQPHTFSRTFMLLDDFAKVLSIPDHAVISDILPVRETNTYNIYAEDLVAKIPTAVHVPTFPEIINYVAEHAKPGDLVITLGGGDVYKCAAGIVKKMKELYGE